MSNLLILTKVMLKNANIGFSLSGLKNKKNIKNIILAVVIIVSMLPFMASIGAAVYTAYDSLAEIQQEGLILGLGLTVVSFAIFFFGIFYIINVFYFSRDIESLLSLPLRPAEILGAKFVVALLYEYLTELIFLAPVLLAFGIRSQADVFYYIYSLLVFLTLPIGPLVYASVISMIVMRYTNIGKNKDRFRIVGGIVALFLALGINLIIQQFTAKALGAGEIRQIMMQGNNSLLGIMNQTFPQNKFAALSLIHSTDIRGIANLGIFIGLVAVFVMIFMYLGEKLYFKGVIGISETSSKKRRMTAAAFEKAVARRPALIALTVQELSLLFRTPVYFMNCVVMNFLWPAFLMLPFVVQKDAAKEMGSISQFLQTGAYDGIILAAVFALGVFVSASNLIASTSISREGRNIYVKKYLPVKYRTQIMAKVLSSVSLSVVAVIMMFIAASVFIILPVRLYLLSVVVCLLGVFFCAQTGLLIDLNFPKLLWDNEQKAVKQNLNGVIHLFACMALAGGTVFLAVWLQLGLWVVFLGLTLLFGVADIILYSILATVGSKLFGKIEI